jgi:hypothetical protein
VSSSAILARPWLALTIPIATLSAIAAASGVLIVGLYRDSPSYVAQAVGQDLISLFVVLPTLIVSAILASRGSPRAFMVWLGALVYLVYCYAIAAFDVRFNSMFLVYVALLGFSLYALIGGLATTNLDAIRTRFTEKTPIKPVSVFLVVMAALFYLVWLSEDVPALLDGKTPQSVIESGTPTNAAHVLDMAWILPAFGITAFHLWRRHALAYTLAGSLMTFLVLLPLAILSMVVYMVRAGQPVVMPMVFIFLVLFAIGLGMLTWFLKSIT